MRNLTYIIIACILTAVAGWIARGQLSEKRNTICITDTIRTTDTVFKLVESVHYLPAPQSAETLRYDGIAAADYEIVHDTVLIRLPVTQKVYSDSDYTAWVSGINPSLDSIRICRHDRTITDNTIVTVKQPPKRWSISLQGGMGTTPDKMQPYIGIGIGYALWQW